MIATYRIISEKFDIIQHELARINKRSEKCGTAGFELIIENTEIEHLSNGEVAVYYIVSIHGEAPKLAGYTFISKLDHNNDPSGASNLIYSMPGVEISESDRARTAYCEHCNRKRYRRDTFLLRRDSDGVIIQVGRSCIKDFIGHNPEQILAYANSYIKIVEAIKATANTFQMNSWRNVSLNHYLTFVALAIRNNGWVSGKQAYETGKISTSQVAWDYMIFHQYDTSVISNEDRDLVSDATAWAKTQDPARSDFFHNMVTIANTGYIDTKSARLAAAIIPVYQKQLENTKKAKLDFTKSNFIGAKGDRLNLDVTVYGKSYGQGAYGPWTRVSMIDSTGNVYVTFASGKFDPSKDSNIKIRGTVKDHAMFNNTKQTNLSRVTLV